jgi:hypothetical protein
MQAGPLVREQRPAQQAQTVWPRENCEEKTAMKFFRKSARMMALNLRASGFD